MQEINASAIFVDLRPTNYVLQNTNVMARADGGIVYTTTLGVYR